MTKTFAPHYETLRSSLSMCTLHCSVIYLMLSFSLFSSSDDDRVLILMIFTLLTLLSLIVVIGCLSCILLSSPPVLQVSFPFNCLDTLHPSPLQTPCDPWLPDRELTSGCSTPVHEFDFGFGLVDLSPARRCSNLYTLNTLDTLYHNYLYTLNTLDTPYHIYILWTYFTTTIFILCTTNILII